MSTSLRLLFVSHDSSLHGAQRMLLTLLQHLDRDCFEAYVVVPNDGGLAEKIRDLNIPTIKRHLVHWLPCTNHIKKGRFGHFCETLGDVRARSWALAALIERYEIDIVYTNTITCVEGAVAARMSGIPHIWHIHEPILGNSELVPIMPAWFYQSVVKVLSSTVIFPSQSLAGAYPSLAAKAAVVYNGLPIPTLPNKSSARQRLASAAAQDPSCKFVAVVGALQPRKDHFSFLDAAKRILEKRSDVRFLIVGSGPAEYSECLRAYIRTQGITQSVQLVGWWPGDISELLRGLDVLVISSEQESFGLTAIEALAMETPVVSTRCGGPEEIIEDGLTGYLAPVKDSVALADSILKLVSNSEQAERFGLAGRKSVEARFAEGHYVGSIQRLILGAVKSFHGHSVSNEMLKE